eukprot:gene13325-17856_t
MKTEFRYILFPLVRIQPCIQAPVTIGDGNNGFSFPPILMGSFPPIDQFFVPTHGFVLPANRTTPFVSSLHTIITEVSNTPWIEQYPYILNETNKSHNLKIYRNDALDTFEATWNKEFHVSPFMEMDYKYSFTFSKPTEVLKVISKLVKISTNELWFTANFELQRIPFTPINLLYVLIFYPLHTRVIQVLIHWEALKLFLKGIPTFEHPHGTDVDFGYGVTGKRLIYIFSTISAPIYYIKNLFTSPNYTTKKNL